MDLTHEGADYRNPPAAPGAAGGKWEANVCYFGLPTKHRLSLISRKHMSDYAFAFTDELPLPEAKKLLAFLQKPGKNGRWRDWSGEGGFEIEVKRNGLRGEELSALELPAYISSISVSSENSQKLGVAGDLPDHLFLGGDDWRVPDYDCQSAARFDIQAGEFNYPLRICHTKQTEMRFYGRSFNACEGFMIQASTKNSLTGQDSLALPTADTVNHFIDVLRGRFGFPSQDSDGILESSSIPKGGFVYYLDPSKAEWLKHGFREMMEIMIGEAASSDFKITARINIGSTLKFNGQTRNVREDAQELLQRIGEHNSYPTYDLTYYVVGPQDWRGREKSRKKWKKPIHQELGTAALENGAVATVKLRIEKEGYVFTLDFEREEDFGRFPGTKLFEKFKWNSGAE
jgi:hypothetical protein